MIEAFTNHFQVFMLMFARIAALFNTAPIIASAAVKIQIRMALAFLITLILFPVCSQYMPAVPAGVGAFYLLIIVEVLIGVIMGFLLSIIFAGFQMAGQYFSVQIGFGYTEVLDPVSQSSLPVISMLKNMLGMMLFLIIGAHRTMIESLGYSFEKVRIIDFTNQVNQGIMKTFEYAIGAMFVVAFKISLPVMGILILVSIAEALMGKAAPQLNILQLSFPARIVIGLLVMISITPFIVEQMILSIDLSFDRLNLFLQEWPN